MMSFYRTTNKYWDESVIDFKLSYLRFKDKKIIFTNGCFDILHIGHITYLEECRSLGDFLVVGINSDSSVKKLKGDKRPINPLEDRMRLLASLQCVDAVISFEEETPISLIQKIKPYILCKGGDYSIENIVGADWVISKGGYVKIIPFVNNHSTTLLINKITNL